MQTAIQVDPEAESAQLFGHTPFASEGKGAVQMGPVTHLPIMVSRDQAPPKQAMLGLPFLPLRHLPAQRRP